MTFANTYIPSTFLSVVARPFLAIGRLLVRMSEGCSHMPAVEQLSALSDAELAAMGTTRRHEVERIFAGRMHL